MNLLTCLAAGLVGASLTYVYLVEKRNRVQSREIVRPEPKPDILPGVRHHSFYNSPFSVN